MKKIFTLAMMMVMTISANAMSYNAAKNEALFLSDKMAYELNLTAAQYEAVYEINLDYLMSVNGRNDAYGTWWNRRNTDLKYVLTAWQYEKFMDMSYFYRPLIWKNKPASTPTAKHGNDKKSSGNGSTWRNTTSNNHDLAHNTNNRNSGSRHFGGHK